nr:uncharacterized protein LOC107970572 isoform X4 [Pan troglodytes]
MRNCGRLRRSGQRRGGTDRCEAVLTGADRCGPVRTGAGRCRPVQARPGRGEAGGRVRGPRRTAASRTWREIEEKWASFEFNLRPQGCVQPMVLEFTY